MKAKYSEKDFEMSNMPSNRARQFFTIFRIEWKTLLLLNLLILIFFIPYFAIEILRWSVCDSYYQSIVATSTNIDQDYAVMKFYIDMVYAGIMLFIYPLISICMAGVIKVIQRCVYIEGVLFKEDFFLGIKKNWKQFVGISIIYGLFKALLQFNISFCNINVGIASSIFQGVSIAIFYGVIAPILLFTTSNVATYKMSVFTGFSNAFKMFIKKFYISLLFSLVLYGLTYLDLIPNIIIRVFVCSGVILIISSLFVLAWYLFSVSIFDAYLNKDNYPEIYRKGLRP